MNRSLRRTNETSASKRVIKRQGSRKRARIRTMSDETFSTWVQGAQRDVSDAECLGGEEHNGL
jgi:hypothetical protein